jgi:transcriptional regulator with XRE-family HTH domain
LTKGLVVVNAERDERDRNELRRPQREAFMRDLYLLLDQKKVSQRQLRDDMGWGSHTVINRWRHYITEPDPEQVFALEEYLDVPPGSLSHHLGYLPVRPTGAGRQPKLDEVIQTDPVLPAWGKEILLTAYREIMRSLGRGRRR